MRTYTFEELHPTIPGPWADEPDKAQWIDEATDLDCLMKRNYFGALCGYVGVPPGHPWHGVDYDDVPSDLVEVHHGLTYSAFCEEGAEDGPGICHIPEPGRPANVWWLGFDCGHLMDVMPMQIERLQGLNDVQDLVQETVFGYRKTYKTFEYVRTECAKLAQQIAFFASDDTARQDAHP